MKKILLLVVTFLFWSTSVFAEPITKIVFFGDSLTDNGNLYNFLHLKIIPKSPPYYEGRFSNGLAWADIAEGFFRNKYNIESANYAVGGATVELLNPFEGNLPYVMNQEVDDYLLRSTWSDRRNTLFVIWVGANDYTGGRSNIDSATTGVVNSITGTITNLIQKHGARNFLVMNLPDLSKIPYAKTVTFSDQLHDMSVMHNTKLAQSIAKLKNEYRNTRFAYVDTFDIFDDLIAHPEKFNQRYNKHFQNTFESCWKGGYSLQGKNKKQEVNELSVEIAKAMTNRNLGKKVDPQKMANFILN